MSPLAQSGLPASTKSRLAGALTNQKRKELEAWKASNDQGFFLLDSIDEAKLDSIRIETAFKKLADGIDSALGRATILFAGRYSDWEFKSDLHRLEAMLPIAFEKIDGSRSRLRP